MKKFLNATIVSWILCYLLILLYGAGLIAKVIVIDGKSYLDKWSSGMLFLVFLGGAMIAIPMALLVENVWKKIKETQNYQILGGGQREQLYLLLESR